MDKASSSLPKQRIHALDLLRGFALLGILIMNIISFSHIGGAYINPTLGPGIEGMNGVIHGFGYLFAEMRFMGLFSLLFGAGLVLFTQNLSRKGLSERKYHYRRMFFLLLFGMIHAYLIWMGDILVVYSICGAIIFGMRKWKTKTLAIMAICFFLIPILFNLGTYYFTPPDILNDIFSFWTPDQQTIDEELAAYRGSYLDQMGPRIEGAIGMQTFMLITDFIWRTMAMMLLGMILFRKGVLSGTKSLIFYKKLMFLGFGIGLLLSSASLYQSYANNWNGVWALNIGMSINTIASVFVGLGYIGSIMIWYQTDVLKGLQSRLQSAGRMAFTNYIGTSVLCTFIFYGHGLGLFGSMNRMEMSLVVILIWMLMLILSPLILRKYRQGPLEYLWRKLTYGKLLKQ